MASIICPRCGSWQDTTADRCAVCNTSLALARRLQQGAQDMAPAVPLGGAAGLAAALSPPSAPPPRPMAAAPSAPAQPPPMAVAPLAPAQPPPMAAAPSAPAQPPPMAGAPFVPAPTPPPPAPSGPAGMPLAGSAEATGWATVQTAEPVPPVWMPEPNADAPFLAPPPRPETAPPPAATGPASAPGGKGWGIREQRGPGADQHVFSAGPQAAAAAPYGVPAYGMAPAALAPPGHAGYGAPPAGYAPYGPPPAGYGMAVPYPPAPWERTTKRRGGGTGRNLLIYLVMRITIVALVGGGIFAFTGRHTWVSNLFHSSHSIQLPASVDGEPQLTTGQLAGVASTLNSSLLQLHGVQQALTGVYGDPQSSKVYMVSVLKGDHNGMTKDDVVGGLSGSGVVVDTQATTARSIDGTDYVCSPITGANGANAVVCVWDDYDVMGLVIDFNAVNADLAATVAAKVKGDSER